MLPLLRRNCIPSPPAHHHHSSASASVPATPEQSPPCTRPRLPQRAPPAPVPPPGNPRRRSSKTAERSARGDEPGAESLGVKRDGVRGGPADTSGGSPPPSCKPQRPTARPFVFRQIGHQSGGAPRLTRAPSPEDGMRPCAASRKRSNDLARACACPFLSFLPSPSPVWLPSPPETNRELDCKASGRRVAWKRRR